MASDAVGIDRISRTVGYKLTKGDFRTSSPNLPQRVALFGEANNANQGTLNLLPVQITSAKQAGALYGYGSPIHVAARILFPRSGDGIGGIPVYVYPQLKAGSSTSKTLTITPTGTATGNGTHRLVIAGRNNIDGVGYDINIVTGDTVADIAVKIKDAINNVLGSPVTGTNTSSLATATAKWSGLTSQEITITVDTGDDNLGITYAIVQTVAGAGTPSIASSLAEFGSVWNTLVLNGYGIVTSVIDALEDFNGIPDPESPTGRYAGIIMKPFIALTGTTLDNPSTFSDAHLNDVTIALCPAPGSKGLSIEAAANYCVMFAVKAQNQPQLDIGGDFLPDMPVPDSLSSLGSMADYNTRDAYVKKGCTTVDLVGNRYQVQDFVTTYHPTGEEPPQYRYSRDIMLDLNVYYGYYLKELINVIDHVIANDDDIVTANKVVKPKMWKQVLIGYADDLANRALIVDAKFMKDSIDVSISTSNPNRFETFFKYKRSGLVRISSTTAEAGFNFGNI